MAWTFVALALTAAATLLRAPPSGPSETPGAEARPEQAIYRGPARVVDGDTLVVDGRRIRMFGIDAPETHQDCTEAGRTYRCGEQARAALLAFIDGRPVSCAQQDVDRYGRSVGRCAAGEQDLGSWMVGHGWAVAYRQYSKAYIAEEDAARTAGLGVWAGDFELPWQWRREQRARSAGVARNREEALGLIASAPGSI